MALDPNITEAFEEALKAHTERMGFATTELKDLVKAQANFAKSIKALNKDVEKGSRGYKEQLLMIDRLNDAIEEEIEAMKEATDQEEKDTRAAHARALQAQRDALKQQAASQKTSEAMDKFGETVSTAAIKGTGKFVRDLQSGANATELANTILSAGIDMAGSGLQVLGSSMQSAGAAISIFPTVWSKAIGLSIAGLGTLAEGLSGTGAKLLKFGVEVLGKELDKTIKAFNEISSVGAAFTNGLTGMRDAALDSNLTIEQFSKVLVANSMNIAEAGLGYTATMNRLSNVQKAMASGVNSTRAQLLKLGFSAEEQASLVLETMADMRRGGLLRSASDRQIQEQTKNYAENLRIIAAVTGEDAKKKVAAARTEMMNTAIQAKLLELQKNNPAAYAKMRDVLATAPAELATAIKQQFALGDVFEPLSAAVMTQVPELHDAVRGYVSIIEDGNVEYKDAAKLAADQNALIGRALTTNIKDLSILGQAHLAGVQGLPSQMDSFIASVFEKTGALDPDIGKKAKDGIEGQMNATDALTESIKDAALAAQALAIALQAQLLPLLNKYSVVSSVVLDGMAKAIADAGLGRSATDLQALTTEQQTAGWWKNMVYSDEEQIKTAKRRQWAQQQGFKESGLGGWTGPKGETYWDSGDLPGLPEDMKNKWYQFGYAKGGVAEGPLTGYQTTLHGTEAVVPLPDNRTIPVSLDSSSLTSSINQQTTILQQVLSEMTKNNSLTSQIVQNSY